MRHTPPGAEVRRHQRRRGQHRGGPYRRGTRVCTSAGEARWPTPAHQVADAGPSALPAIPAVVRPHAPWYAPPIDHRVQVADQKGGEADDASDAPGPPVEDVPVTDRAMRGKRPGSVGRGAFLFAPESIPGPAAARCPKKTAQPPTVAQVGLGSADAPEGGTQPSRWPGPGFVLARRTRGGRGRSHRPQAASRSPDIAPRMTAHTGRRGRRPDSVAYRPWRVVAARDALRLSWGC